MVLFLLIVSLPPRPTLTAPLFPYPSRFRSGVASVEAELAALPVLRRAEGWEFTRRAFLNGRIDLAEAEGLADLLAAETESQRRSALGMASGHVSRAVAAWQDRLLTLMAAAEAEQIGRAHV